MPFHPRSEAELGTLSDEDLIDHLRSAHAAGDLDAARLALQILVYGYWRHVELRLDRKLPDDAVEDVTGDVIVRAIQSAFSGVSVGEFRSWLNTITDRAIADFYRARNRRPEEAPLVPDDDDQPSTDPAAPDGRGYVETQMVVEEALAELRPDHRRVVFGCRMLPLTSPADRGPAAERAGGTSRDRTPIARQSRSAAGRRPQALLGLPCRLSRYPGRLGNCLSQRSVNW